MKPTKVQRLHFFLKNRASKNLFSFTKAYLQISLGVSRNTDLFLSSFLVDKRMNTIS